MNNDPALQGARQIVNHCLGLLPQQDLIVFLDETTTLVANHIITAAIEIGVSVTPIFIPTSLQRQIPSNSSLSLPISWAMRDARAIITCVTSAPDCLSFRDYILENERGVRTRIGHMPGATVEVLAMANVDFHRLIADCALLEQAMLRGSKLKLTSYSARGAEHQLTAFIGGWDRLAIASDGIIRDGAWGNVPSGETYIAPIEGTADGRVVINGSVPGLVIAPGEEIVLTFASGRLVGLEPEYGSVAQWLHKTQIDLAERQDDINWTNLAEIGIGTNPAVKHLTGTMLFDEKSAGTVHIALGSNIHMGGRVASAIHCDMVITGPSVYIDDKPVIRRGVLSIIEDDWFEDFSKVTLPAIPLREKSEVARTGVDAELREGHLRRVFRSETGRVALCQVGNEETARLAASLYVHIPVNSYAIELGRLIAQARLPIDTVRRVLAIMQTYGLVQITNT